MRFVRLQAVVENLRSSFWLVPATSIVLALVGGVLLPRVHVAAEGRLARYVFSGGSDGARGVLEAIAGSVITVTSLTFSLTIVTLQLASSQFSPRLLRTFLRDLRTQGVLGILLATFLYSLTVLRTVRAGGPTTPEQVPQVAVTVAFLLVVASLVALVWFIQHIVDVIRVDSLMADVRAESVAVIDAVHPEADGGIAIDRPAPPLPPDPVAPGAPASGFLLGIDTQALCSWARDADALVAIDAAPGDWLLAGAPWARVWGVAPDAGLDRALRRRVEMGTERTTQQDAAYGLRQLVDVATKALSPGINDPTTAVHAIGHLGDLLVRLAGRPLGTRTVHDDSGTLRVVTAGPAFADYLELGFGQLRRYGAAEPAVVHALLDVLDALARRVQTGVRREGVRTQLDALAADAGRQTSSEHDAGSVAEHVARVGRALAVAG